MGKSRPTSNQFEAQVTVFQDDRANAHGIVEDDPGLGVSLNARPTSGRNGIEGDRGLGSKVRPEGPDQGNHGGQQKRADRLEKAVDL